MHHVTPKSKKNVSILQPQSQTVLEGVCFHAWLNSQYQRRNRIDRSKVVSTFKAMSKFTF